MEVKWLGGDTRSCMVGRGGFLVGSCEIKVMYIIGRGRESM